MMWVSYYSCLVPVLRKSNHFSTTFSRKTVIFFSSEPPYPLHIYHEKVQISARLSIYDVTGDKMCFHAGNHLIHE